MDDPSYPFMESFEKEDRIACLDRSSDGYLKASKEFDADYARKREYIGSMLGRVGLSHDSVARPLAGKVGEKNIKNVKITDLRYVSFSSNLTGLIDGVFIDWEHFDGWEIKKYSTPMKGLEIKLEEKENDGFKSI